MRILRAGLVEGMADGWWVGVGISVRIGRRLDRMSGRSFTGIF
jgi:hypothetical protein